MPRSLCPGRAANQAFATRRQEPAEGVKINEQMELRGPVQELSAWPSFTLLAGKEIGNYSANERLLQLSQ